MTLLVIRLLRILLHTILFALLTVLTQIGGIVYFISVMIFPLIDRNLRNSWGGRIAKVSSFTALYLAFVFIIVPLAATVFGRVPLPLFKSGNVQPANFLTVLLNRHYVRPELRTATMDVARTMNVKYPGTTLNYLDANFPFIDGFPLFPHLSHSDGKKLDLSFHYIDATTLKQTDRIPSWLGYGVCEIPRSGEYDRPAECSKKGFWQYSFMFRNSSQKNRSKYRFDPERTKDLVNYYAAHKTIGKILIEPHLRTRLGLRSGKVRLHGCNAVRHDDHIHVQLK